MANQFNNREEGLTEAAVLLDLLRTKVQKAPSNQELFVIMSQLDIVKILLYTVTQIQIEGVANEQPAQTSGQASQGQRRSSKRA